MLGLRQISQAYHGVPVLHGITLEVAKGEIVCLLGPSGCGKTTLLRIIAGLEPYDSGVIMLDGKSIESLPVHQRDFGLMFQDYALFPHMSVAENILFGLRMHHSTRSQQQARLSEILAITGLAGLEDRSVTELSGGERQRVALARSLAPRPHLLMLDEPLGSLDAALRSQLIMELHRIIKSIGLTAIYVTHDQSEAFAIADRIAVMRDGTIEQIDAPETLYTRPRTAFTARFMGLENIVPVTGYRGSSVLTAIGEFCVPGTPSEVLIHPTGIRLFPDITEERLTARVQERVFRGNTYRIVVITDKAAVPLVFDMPLKARFIPAIGVTVSLDIKPDMVLPLSPSPSRNAL